MRSNSQESPLHLAHACRSGQNAGPCCLRGPHVLYNSRSRAGLPWSVIHSRLGLSLQRGLFVRRFVSLVGMSTPSTPPSTAVRPKTPRGLLKTPQSAASRRRRKSVRFSGAAEIPFQLGSPVAHHLGGRTPDWSRSTRGKRKAAEVYKELTARGVTSIPATQPARLQLLHTEYCKELLAGLVEEDVVPADVQSACRASFERNPTGTLRRLRGMRQMFDHLQVRGLGASHCVSRPLTCPHVAGGDRRTVLAKRLRPGRHKESCSCLWHHPHTHVDAAVAAQGAARGRVQRVRVRVQDDGGRPVFAAVRRG